jgi:hypothetical protein
MTVSKLLFEMSKVPKSTFKNLHHLSLLEAKFDSAIIERLNEQPKKRTLSNTTNEKKVLLKLQS